MNAASREGLKITGTIKISSYQSGMVETVKPYLDQWQSLRQLPESADKKDRLAALKERIEQIKSSFFIRTAVECPNLIMDSPNYGLDLVIQRLAGINTYSLNILWIEIGTGSTTPTVNDTGLTTPSLRAAVNFQEDFGTTDAIVQCYITDAQLANATYAEVGGFVDGTSSIGTGQIFNHSLLSPAYGKTAGNDTTIQIDVSVTNA